MSTLPKDDTAFLKWLKSRLRPEVSVDPDNSLYVPVSVDPAHDPVALIFRDITLAGDSSLNFLSGFNGSGKSSQLLRLQKLLHEKGYFVAFGNALDYFLPTQPVSIELFLISLAGAFSDALEKDHDLSVGHESYWQRFVHWLGNTQVSLEGFDLDAKVLGSGIKFKTLLKENPSFIQILQKQMERRPKELRDQVHAFFNYGIERIRAKHGAHFSPVFIFDQFEHLHDTSTNGGSVADSIITIVSNHQQDLAIAGHHMVITMPPWLKLVTKNVPNVRFIYSVKLWGNSDKRPVQRVGRDFLREVVLRRFTEEGLDRFFGPLNGKGVRPLVDQLVQASGGHLRDLIILLNETILRSTDLPVGREEVKAAIDHHRNAFLPISLDQARCLGDIAQHRICALPDSKPETIYNITQLLNSHCALILRNGSEWFDVHPIIRDTVKDILSRYDSPNVPQTASPPAA
jgi:hypothetical protein